MSIIKKIKQEKIYAVVRTNDCQKAVDISMALIEGGVKIIEITTENPDSIKAIEEISKIDDVSVSAGGIITTQQAERAILAGAKLIVSPVMEMSILKLTKGYKVPIITGASTPNEAYCAWKLGIPIVKLTPARAMGGPHYIKDLLLPMPFLSIMPTSGVTIDDFVDYLDAGAVAVSIGRDFYKDPQHSVVRDKAKIVVEKLRTKYSKD